MKTKVKKTAAAAPLLTEAVLKAETDIFPVIIGTTTTTTTEAKLLHSQQFPSAQPVLSKLNLMSVLVLGRRPHRGCLFIRVLLRPSELRASAEAAEMASEGAGKALT